MPQFGSDLDKATQSQLNRGQRLVELLKQNQFSPLPFSKQILIIFAGTGGFLDDLPVNQVRDFRNRTVQIRRRNQSRDPAHHHGKENSRRRSESAVDRRRSKQGQAAIRSEVTARQAVATVTSDYMPNILDIRRRIRSVVNTRQITKAMKMVSAAKLRRAQDRALAARPYAQMLTNILKSLVSRAEIYDPETGAPKHPLLAQRPEQNILLIVVTGDKGLAGAFSANITKAAARFLESKSGKNIDIEAIGRKGRDFLRRRYPSASVQTRSLAGTDESLDEQPESRDRAGEIQITGEHVGVLNKLEFSQVRSFAESVIKRYEREEIDSVYVVFNEFKSVIAQRLIVEQILPIEQIGEQAVRLSEEMTEEEKKKAKEAAISAGVGMRSSDTRRRSGCGAVRHFAGRLHLRAGAGGIISRAAAEVCRHSDFPCDARIHCGRARRPHDRHGFGHEQCHRHDRLPDARDEPRPPGEDHERNYRDRERRGGNVTLQKLELRASMQGSSEIDMRSIRSRMLSGE